MLFISAIKNAIQATYQHFTLPDKIHELEAELRRPLTESFSRQEKYYAMIDLAQLDLYTALKSEGESSRDEAINVYLRKVREYQMEYQTALEDTPASKFDIEKLTVAINEIALLLDKNIESFDESSKTCLTQFLEQAQRVVKEERDKMDSAQSDMERKAKQILDKTESAMSEKVAVMLQEQKKRADTVLTEAKLDFEKRSGTVIDGFQARSQQVVSEKVSELDSAKSDMANKMEEVITSTRDAVRVVTDEFIALMESQKSKYEEFLSGAEKLLGDFTKSSEDSLTAFNAHAESVFADQASAFKTRELELNNRIEAITDTANQTLAKVARDGETTIAEQKETFDTVMAAQRQSFQRMEVELRSGIESFLHSGSDAVTKFSARGSELLEEQKTNYKTRVDESDSQFRVLASEQQTCIAQTKEVAAQISGEAAKAMEEYANRYSKLEIGLKTEISNGMEDLAKSAREQISEEIDARNPGFREFRREIRQYCPRRDRAKGP